MFEKSEKKNRVKNINVYLSNILNFPYSGADEKTPENRSGDITSFFHYWRLKEKKTQIREKL